MKLLRRSDNSYNEPVNEYIGMSTDTKPTDCPEGSSFVEVDSGTVYCFLNEQ